MVDPTFFAELVPLRWTKNATLRSKRISIGSIFPTALNNTRSKQSRLYFRSHFCICFMRRTTVRLWRDLTWYWPQKTRWTNADGHVWDSAKHGLTIGRFVGPCCPMPVENQSAHWWRRRKVSAISRGGCAPFRAPHLGAKQSVARSNRCVHKTRKTADQNPDFKLRGQSYNE